MHLSWHLSYFALYYSYFFLSKQSVSISLICVPLWGKKKTIPSFQYFWDSQGIDYTEIRVTMVLTMLFKTIMALTECHHQLIIISQLISRLY